MGRGEAYIKELAVTLKASLAHINLRPILAIDDYGILLSLGYIKYRLFNEVPARELYTEILLKRMPRGQYYTRQLLMGAKTLCSCCSTEG